MPIPTREPRATGTPYTDLVGALNGRSVHYAVLADRGASLDRVLRQTADLALAVDIGPENMMLLVQVLADQGYRFARQADPDAARGVPTEVVALTFSRRDRVDADLHVVLAPPMSWGEVLRDTAVQPFGPVAVPVTCWETLLAIEDEKRVIAKRSSRAPEL